MIRDVAGVAVLVVGVDLCWRWVVCPLAARMPRWEAHIEALYARWVKLLDTTEGTLIVVAAALMLTALALGALSVLARLPTAWWAALTVVLATVRRSVGRSARG